jgi:hypothetical protein
VPRHGVIFDCVLHRRHHNDHSCQLLQLPDSILHTLSRAMGKHARALCSELESVYGPPGTTLSPPAILTPNNTESPPKLLAAIKSWRYPASVTQLAVPTLSGHYGWIGGSSALDGPGCHTLAESLPNLRTLICDSIFSAPDGIWPDHHAITPHTALEVLSVSCLPINLHTISTFAPNLRSLTIGQCVYEFDYCGCSGGSSSGSGSGGSSSGSGSGGSASGSSSGSSSGSGSGGSASARSSSSPARRAVWQAVAPLRSLQHLGVGGIQNDHLDTPSFGTAMRQLTALTHLGLALVRWSPGAVMDAASSQRCAHALAALPLLASVKIINFSSIGQSLGAALEALQLTCLELGGQTCDADEDYDVGWFDLPDVPAGCLPDISAMPALQQLTLNTAAVRYSLLDAVQQRCSTCPTALKALSLTELQPGWFLEVCGWLANFPALTSLLLMFAPDTSYEETDTPEEHPEALNRCLARLPQLRHLEVFHGPKCTLLGQTPSLAGLQGVSRLCMNTYVYRKDELSPTQQQDIQQVGSTGSSSSSLKELKLFILEGFSSSPDSEPCRRLCMQAVQQLPMLEDLSLPWLSWTEEEVRMLLPPPGRLKKLRLTGVPNSKDSRRWVLEMTQRLQSYHVDVEIRVCGL